MGAARQRKGPPKSPFRPAGQSRSRQHDDLRRILNSAMNNLVPDDAWTAFEIDQAEVRAWISSALPGSPDLEAECRILNRKDWSIVAEFLTAGGEPIVYKISTLPRLS